MLVLELFRLSNQYLAVFTCIGMIPFMAQVELLAFTIWCIAMCFIEFVVVVYFKSFHFAIFAGIRLQTLIPVRRLVCGFLPFSLQRIPVASGSKLHTQFSLLRARRSVHGETPPCTSNAPAKECPRACPSFPDLPTSVK